MPQQQVIAGPQEPSLTPAPSEVPPTPLSQPPAPLAEPLTIPSESQPPCYSLPRDINTITDLLRLWDHGLGIMPSIRSLEARWGSAWRPSTSRERQAFSSRRQIIDAIHERATAAGEAPETVAAAMDRERGNASLDKVFKALKRRRQQLEEQEQRPAARQLARQPVGPSGGNVITSIA